VRGRADIDNDELNRPTSEEASDVIAEELRTATLVREKSMP
jgi:hypothetical protein